MQRINPKLPRRPLDSLHDLERKIPKGPVWVLTEVQAMLTRGEIKLMTTPKSGEDIRTDFGCSLTDVKHLFQAMQEHHYHDSEWVLLPHAPAEPRPADTYLYPWTQHLAAEVIELLEVYVKFTIRVPHCILASFHISRHP